MFLLDHELEYYGIRVIANEWFSSYLSNRSQFVSLGHVESGPQPILCGLSNTGLFLLYVNDLHKSIGSIALDFLRNQHFLTRSKLTIP